MTATASPPTTGISLTINRPALSEALGLLSRVILSRSPKPVLLCVRLEASGGRLTLRATNLEIDLELSLAGVSIDAEGVAVVAADKLAAVVKASTDPTVTLTGTGDSVVLRDTRGAYTLHVTPASDFPLDARDTGDATPLTVPSATLADVLGRVLHAVSTETSRYATAGVFLSAKGKKLTAAATDGRRLAEVEAKAPAAEVGPVILPTMAAKLLVQALARDGDGSAEVVAGGGTLSVKGDGWTLTSNLVEGSFPPYKDVIPKSPAIKAEADAALLIDSLTRAAILTSEESKGVAMEFSPDGLTLASRAPERGSAEVRMSLASYEGEAIRVGVNPAYLIDAVRACADAGDPESKVEIGMDRPNKPVRVSRGGVTCVVMPVSLQ